MHVYIEIERLEAASISKDKEIEVIASEKIGLDNQLQELHIAHNLCNSKLEQLEDLLKQQQAVRFLVFTANVTIICHFYLFFAYFCLFLPIFWAHVCLFLLIVFMCLYLPNFTVRCYLNNKQNTSNFCSSKVNYKNSYSNS